MFLAIAFVAACADSRTAGAAGEQPVRAGESPSQAVQLRIRAGARAVELRAEVAATDADRSRGLMGRAHLAADAGMLFVYPEQQAASSGFWMYRTRIPLDIAFLDAEGRILAIRAMEPCDRSVSLNCPTYAPGVPYWAALEVNREFFVRNGIEVGDRVLPPSGLSFRAAE